MGNCCDSGQRDHRPCIHMPCGSHNIPTQAARCTALHPTPKRSASAIHVAPCGWYLIFWSRSLPCVKLPSVPPTCSLPKELTRLMREGDLPTLRYKTARQLPQCPASHEGIQRLSWSFEPALTSNPRRRLKPLDHTGRGRYRPRVHTRTKNIDVLDQTYCFFQV